MQRRFGVLRTTARVLRQRPSLVCFPALSFTAVAALLGLAWFLPLQQLWHGAQHSQPPTTAQYLSLAVLFAAISFITCYFTAALIHSAHALLDGRPTTLGVSLHAAAGRLGHLAAWSVLGSTIGLLLQLAESTAGLGTLFELVGVSWTLLTFFALPVIVLEGLGVPAALRRSLALGRKQLGTWVAGGVRLVITTGLLLVGAVVVLILAVESDSLALLFVAAAAVLAFVLLVAIVNSAASGIYRTALYRDAVAEERSGIRSQADQVAR